MKNLVNRNKIKIQSSVRPSMSGVALIQASHKVHN